MSKDLSSKKCETCRHSKYVDDLAPDVVCFYPPIVKTFPDGVPCKEARGPGRYCGPAGECYAPN